MNELSWLLYLAQVSTNIMVLCTFAGVFSLFAAGFFFLCGIVEDDKRGFQMAKKPFIFGVVAIMIATFVPPKETVYMIAASQVGEAVINSPEGQKSIQTLQKILDTYLKNLSGD